MEIELVPCWYQSTGMDHLHFMDDFTPDIRRTLDDAVDAGELLSFRYLNVLDIVRQA